MTWFFGRRRKPAPAPVPRYTVSEAIIISRSPYTPEQWDRLTPQERADIRWNLGLGTPNN